MYSVTKTISLRKKWIYRVTKTIFSERNGCNSEKLHFWPIHGQVGGTWAGGLSPHWNLDPPCLSPSKISVSPPFEIFNSIPPLRKKFIPYLGRFHSPTWKIFDFAKKVPIPPLDFDSPPIRDLGILSPTWKNFSPWLGKIFRIAKRSQSPLWILTVPPLEILEFYPPFGKILLP